MARNRQTFIAAFTGLCFAFGALSPAMAADLPDRTLTPIAPVLEPAWHPFFVRAGVSGVFPDTGINTTINPTTLASPLGPIPIPGSFLPGSGRVNAQLAASFEAGYYITRNIAASISGGFPPTFTTEGQNGLAGQGVLYRVMVGLPVFSVAYHFDNFGPIRPYAGVGVGYAIVFRNESATVLNPLLRNQAAFVLVGGVDYDLSEHWGIFVDVKKAFLTQQFTGRTQPQPVAIPGVGVIGAVQPTVSASVRTDPIIATAGVSYRF